MTVGAGVVGLGVVGAGVVGAGEPGTTVVAGAGAVTGDEGVGVSADHQHIAQGRGLRVGG